MDKHKYELTKCWIYAYGQFVDQAHRLSLRASLSPRMGRDVIGRLHGFGNWARLSQTLEDLHDIGCALALDMEQGAAEVAFRNGVFAQIERLASLNNPIRMQELSRALRPKYRGLSVVSDADNDDLSDAEYEAWGQYEDVKWEMAYRTVWARHGANSASVQNIGIELAERMAAWYPAIAADATAALKIVFDFYGCASEPSVITSAGPIADYLGQEGSSRRRISERLNLLWDEPMPWRRASSLWKELTYVDPAELDGAYDSFPVLALLPHAPPETYLQVHVEQDGTAAPWCETLVRDGNGLARLAFIGRGSALQVSVVDVEMAQDELKAPEKAGWLKVTWDM